ncbi:hypothetical protein [Campylobacter majalis]|uniref:hypothetical protein n=1 Tax=Campylobacter majalis TaxID=2790656 RepID=UPI003D68CB3B
MKKIVLLILFICSLFAFGFDDFKKYFLQVGSNQTAKYLYEYVRDSNVVNEYFAKCFSYNYSYDKDIFRLIIKMPKNISIENYKQLNSFIDTTKRDIKKMLCFDNVFKASLHTTVRLEFEIYNTRYNRRQEMIIYNKNKSIACGLL